MVQKEKKVLLTGDRPTGPLHLGHYVGSLRSRVQMQHDYETFIMVADVQALTDNFKDPLKVQSSVLQVVRDYLAVGLDPERITIFLQSQVPELAELTMYYMNLVTLSRLEQNPTIKSEIQQRGYQGHSIPVGFLCYPISQAADITAFQGEIVPVGEDQVPILEMTNEIVRRFNHTYETDCLKECQAILSTTSRLVGIDGQQKASKSLNNAIFLKDPENVLREKVWQMYTDPMHLRIEDPGHVEGNVVFSYLDAFHLNKDEVAEWKLHYQRGGLGDTTLKEALYQTLSDFLRPIRERRESYEDHFIKKILASGSHRAREKATETLKRVKKAMGLIYGS